MSFLRLLLQDDENSDTEIVRAIEEHHAVNTVPLGYYQGPGVPLPMFTNHTIVLPAEEKLCFDLGYSENFSDSDDNKFKVPEVPLRKKRKVVTNPPPSHSFKTPRSDADMLKMGQKQFATDTYKKIQWVVNMYHSWHVSRNK